MLRKNIALSKHLLACKSLVLAYQHRHLLSMSYPSCVKTKTLPSTKVIQILRCDESYIVLLKNFYASFAPTI